ncbi:hypothetical protein [Paenibacillus naphthalenovorans]|uniref:hypothetical protein n=1 Tax=Paenibacillus naphthalenovorans TaxID=162209 RepID=UPI003D2C004C
MKKSMVLLMIAVAIVLASGCGEKSSKEGESAVPSSTQPSAGTEQKNADAGTVAPPVSQQPEAGTEHKNADTGKASPSVGTPPAKGTETKPSGAGAASQPSPKKAASTDRKIDVDYIKQNLKMNMSQDEVKKLLGSSYTEVTNAMEGNKMWRYDIGTKQGYNYQGEMDSIDMDGLINGSVTIQLFVDWSEEKTVNHYSFLYLKDGKIYEYRVFEDGQVKESIVQE